TPARAPAGAASQEPDGGWPRDYDTPSGAALRVFQPQIGSWDGQKHMVAFSAVSYTAKGATKPTLGTVKLEAGTAVPIDERLVNFDSVRLTEIHFTDLPMDQERDVALTLEGAVPTGALVIALDRVLARLDKSQVIPKNVEGVKADPPTIFYSTKPG